MPEKGLVVEGAKKVGKFLWELPGCKKALVIGAVGFVCFKAGEYYAEKKIQKGFEEPFTVVPEEATEDFKETEEK